MQLKCSSAPIQNTHHSAFLSINKALLADVLLTLFRCLHGFDACGLNNFLPANESMMNVENVKNDVNII